jgi:hypothetical protein
MFAKEEHMLTLTDTAGVVVREIVSRNGGAGPAGQAQAAAHPASHPVGEAENADATQFGVAVAPTPEEHDAVVEAHGARVYLGERATRALDDKTLDAHVDEDGRVAFDLLPQHP